jgi:tRNA 2-thiocytidine biosynthesis protein TtcA
MRDLSKIGSYVSNRIGKAIADYNLIEDKDRILVGVSGGKDSYALLKLLSERRKWAPVKYELVAIHVESDYDAGRTVDKKELIKFFKNNKIEYHFEKIKILDKKRGVNCFWCSWNRRKALFFAADRLGCNKIALGHHKDDIIETLLLNLFYHGEFAGMNPRQELFGGKVIIIRPLCYVEESFLKKFSKESDFKTQVCRCPNADVSKRRKMKGLIKEIEKDCEYVRTNLFSSMARIKKDYIQVESPSDLSFEEAKL